MKKILYIGNKLARHGRNQTGIDTLGPLLEARGFRLVYASSQKNKLLRLFDMLAATLRHSNADYVLIDTYSTVNFWYALLVSQLCRLLRIKYVPILHGGDLPRRLKQNPGLCRMVFGHSLVNVAPSGYLRHAFTEASFQTVMVPNAIPIGDYTFKQRNILKPKLLWVRAFSSIYNPQMAVRVLAALKGNYPDAALCMVGPDKDGSLAQVKALAEELGVEVRFTGGLSKSEWLKLAQDYDVFINTTHYDNMPVSVIEAMALGLAVVSTNVGGLPFLLEDQKTALLVNDNDAVEMTKCIDFVLKNPDFALQMVQNAHIHIGAFDAGKVASHWAEILK